MAIGRTAAQKTRGAQSPARQAVMCHKGSRPKPGLASPANVSKQGLSARSFASHQTPIVVNVWLPKGISDTGNTGRPRT
jgi:hypothetical protein